LFFNSGHVTLIFVVACNAQHLKLVFSSTTKTVEGFYLVIDSIVKSGLYMTGG